jgi:hypothetical protein
MKNKIILCLALVLSGGLFGCSTTTKNRPSDLPVIYHNAKYDFTFFLPASWQGYSVLIQQWDGENYLSTEDKDVIVGHGAIIILRYPQWKANKPYQDIEILFFTRSQWDALKHGKLWPSLYAGGVMDELWHNHKYVFAMSSRYNWGELKGSEEVAGIVNKNCAAHPAPHLYQE